MTDPNPIARWRPALEPDSKPALGAALEELARVHRLEQARLLRAASYFRSCARPGSAGCVVPRPRARSELRYLRSRAAWRTACLEEIAAAAADGFDVHESLSELVVAPVGSWPSPSRLALAALAIEHSHAGLVALARSWIAERRLEEALELLLDLLEVEPMEDLRLESLEAAAVALELAGDADGSLACYEAALDSKGGDFDLAVPLLALALRTGDSERVRAGVRRLHGVDVRVPGVRARFDKALAKTGIRCRTSPGRDEEGARDLLGSRLRRFLRRNRGPEAEVARLVLRS